ncbi:MAG TPA: M64 family metallopeptidase [Rhizomicrobium sp.]|nr:M64 family metallopeptidase [Rhizomicrobium sp.]
MGTRAGRIVRTTKIVDHGSDALRFNVVMLSDGFQEAELPRYRAAVDAFVARFQQAGPFDALWPAINVYRVDVISTDSSVDDESNHISRRTYFDSCFDPKLSRLLCCDTGAALAAAKAQVAAMAMTFVVANTGEYGGSGGDAAVFSINEYAADIGLHEMGHTVCKLADEYACYACGNDNGASETGHEQYDHRHDNAPNIAPSLKRPLKWEALLTAPADPLPTTKNADCGKCDPQPDPKPAGYVGAYEGAAWFHCGGYRPSHECRMRIVNRPFCAVCRGVITAMLKPYMP